MRIGIFGGTFNPIHQAHLQTAAGARDALMLDTVLLMVAADPPHKAVAGAVPAVERLHMAQLAAEAEPGVAACDLELRRTGKSYTVETLRELHGKYPGAELFLIVGSDMLQDIPKWFQPQEILRMAAIAAVPRKGYEQDDAGAAALLRETFGARVEMLPVAPEALSSTEVRERLLAARPVTGLVAPAVERYIYESGLYFPLEIRQQQAQCRAALRPERFRHTMSVVRMAAALSERYGADAEKARVAALLHDCAKELDKRRLSVLSGDDTDALPTLHAGAGAVLAHNDYGVSDEAVLRAIRRHCTGEAGMSLLDMTVYLSDMAEEGRDYPGISEIRAALADPVQGMRTALARTMAHLIERGYPVHPATERAMHYFDQMMEVRN